VFAKQPAQRDDASMFSNPAPAAITPPLSEAPTRIEAPRLKRSAHALIRRCPFPHHFPFFFGDVP
jgi:hypothetical protein